MVSVFGIPRLSPLPGGSGVLLEMGASCRCPGSEGRTLLSARFEEPLPKVFSELYRRFASLGLRPDLELSQFLLNTPPPGPAETSVGPAGSRVLVGCPVRATFSEVCGTDEDRLSGTVYRIWSETRTEDGSASCLLDVRVLLPPKYSTLGKDAARAALASLGVDYGGDFSEEAP